IAENAGEDGSVIAQKVKESSDTNFGYNALTHEYGDMMKMGVIVPTKVERTALQNAASIASLLLTTDAIVSEIIEDKPEPAGAPDIGAKTSNFFYLTAAARDYGWTNGTQKAAEISLTEVGKKLAEPETPRDEAAALIHGFFKVPAFRQVVEYYKGPNLPEQQ